MTKVARAWGEAHRREALRRTYEIAAAMVGRGDPNGPTNGKRAAWHLVTQIEATDEEHTWRILLVTVKLTPTAIDREVRRVRALAEGRLVRDVTWRGESGEEYDRRDVAARDKSHGGGRLTRVTRIRRAP